MKRLLIILIAACLSLGARGQVRSIGATFGSYEAVSFQHMVYGTDNVFQLDLGYHVGLPDAGAVKLMASYNINILSPKWTSEGEWNFYAGPGVYLGGGWAPGKGLTFGLMAMVGLEYIFDDLPLQLSADMRPSVGMIMLKDVTVFDKDSLLGLVPTVSARYMF
jgi:hypothetical protein